jgi:hypothetical protein
MKIHAALSDVLKKRVPIAARFPLTQAAQAHERLERGYLLARIALRIRGRSR